MTETKITKRFSVSGLPGFVKSCSLVRGIIDDIGVEEATLSGYGRTVRIVRYENDTARLVVVPVELDLLPLNDPNDDHFWCGHPGGICLNWDESSDIVRSPIEALPAIASDVLLYDLPLWRAIIERAEQGAF